MELTIEQCATWIIPKFEEGGIPNLISSQALKRSVAAIASNDLPLPSDNKEPSEEFLKKCIDTMRKRECWGCKSPDHTLDQCPTHCITEKSNLVDKTKIVERSFPKRDQTFKKTNTKKVNFVANDDTISQPAVESSGEDLCTTFGHLTSKDPSKLLDFDNHMLRKIAKEFKNEYDVCSSHPFDTSLDFEYNDDYMCTYHAINTVERTEPCYECGSTDHSTHRDCPYLEVVHYTNDETQNGFEFPY